jgi:cytochrome c biogenesis protein CcmG/thiol:disulfide interchange protein DsbE
MTSRSNPSRSNRSRSGATPGSRGRGSGARPARGRSPAVARARRSDRPSRLLPLALAAVVVAGLVAVVLTAIGRDGDTDTTRFDTDRASVAGTALPPLPETGRDPGAGERAPLVEGRDRNGEAQRLPVEGRPTVLLFLAHWCPHCLREVPAVQEWADAGELPEDVDVVAVSTAVDPDRPNHPPSAWLEDEGWTLPTVADADGRAAVAYGLTAFPFWVAVDDQGTVVERRTGELGLDELRDLAANAVRGAEGSTG